MNRSKRPMPISQPVNGVVEATIADGAVILVDFTDVPRLLGRQWRIGSRGYVVGSVKNRNTMIHRYLLDAPPDRFVDHINGIKTDNRRANLRFCTSAQNAQNRKVCSLSTTGLKGVHLNKVGNHISYRARIRINGRRINLGSFTNPHDAHRAYIEAAKSVHKEFFHA